MLTPPSWILDVPNISLVHHLQNWPTNINIYWLHETYKWKWDLQSILEISQPLTFRKDHTVFSNIFWAASIFVWQYSRKFPVLRVAWSWFERSMKSVSVTTWLTWTTCAAVGWGCWAVGLMLSKVTSFPPNCWKKKRQNKRSVMFKMVDAI